MCISCKAILRIWWQGVNCEDIPCTGQCHKCAPRVHISKGIQALCFLLRSLIFLTHAFHDPPLCSSAESEKNRILFWLHAKRHRIRKNDFWNVKKKFYDGRPVQYMWLWDTICATAMTVILTIYGWAAGNTFRIFKIGLPTWRFLRMKNYFKLKWWLLVTHWDFWQEYMLCGANTRIC